MARNRIIGAANGLPWRMRSDLRQFKAATMGKPLIMGRKTYQSIGRPLPGRDIVVVTRDPGFRPDGVHPVDNLAEAVRLAGELGRQRSADEIVVAGGADVYAQAMDRADRLLLTQIELDVEGDAVFPPVDPDVWRQASLVAYAKGDGDDADFTVADYVRRQARP